MKYVVLFIAAVMSAYAFPVFGQLLNLVHHSKTAEQSFGNGTPSQPWPITSPINAINYDIGGSGIGYVNPGGNNPNCLYSSPFRPDTVNFKTSTAGPPYQLGCSSQGVVYKYTIAISGTGPFTITANLADSSAGGSWRVAMDGSSIGTIATPNTGSFTTFQGSSLSAPFNATAGNHTIQFTALGGDAAFNGSGDFLSFQVSPAGVGIVAALGPPFSGVVPTPALNAGFTTLIANYDWSNGTAFTYNGNTYNWQNVASYIDCAITNGNPPLWWNLSYSGSTKAPCGRYSIVNDANFGSNVLEVLYTPADYDAREFATDLETQSTTNPGPCSLGPPISCTGSGAPASWFPSQFYIEVVQSLNQNGSYGTGTCGTPISVIGGVFSFSSPNGPLETDQSELYNNGNQCTNGGNTIDHSTSTFLSPSPQIGAGVDPSKVNTYGDLQTANASTNVWSRCNYVDSGLIPSNTAARTQIGCGTNTLSSGVLTTRTEWKLPLGPENVGTNLRPSGNLVWHIEAVRIWGCSGWATGHC